MPDPKLYPTLRFQGEPGVVEAGRAGNRSSRWRRLASAKAWKTASSFIIVIC